MKGTQPDLQGGQAVFSIVPQPIKVVAVMVFVVVVVVNRIVVAFF